MMSTRLGSSLTALALAIAGCRASDTRAPIAASSVKWQLDRVGSSVGVPRFTALGGRDGSGITVAVIDGGFDVRHPMLRRRARWVLDHGGRPRGESAESSALERRFRGAVWSGAALERAIEQENSSGQREPSLVEDPIGHGTFVASVAAGGALSPGFEGLAPGADLVLARVGSANGIPDESIIDALDFAIDRSGAQPLIVVLAAGSADGTHDGTSALERAIDQRFLGQSRRMIVMAAGNEGGAATHRRALVRRDQGAVALSFALRSSAASTRSFSVVHEGVIDVALESATGERTRWVSIGEHPGAQLGAFRVGIDRTFVAPTVALADESLRRGELARSAVITFEHATPQAETRWRLLVRGDATMDLYASASDVRFDYGDDRGSLVVPATATSAVVVNAIVTRDQWPAPSGAEHLEPIARRADGVARFASLGPDRVHRARPDLSAPGGWVLGARSAQCDATSAHSLCSSARGTDDPRTIAAAGTSVAAPVAAGALARLWSTRGELDPESLVSRITAASDRWSPSLGWGAIDLGAALEDAPSLGARCTVVASTESVFAGEPVTFAVRVFGERRAASERPAIAVEVDPDSEFSVQPMVGGRAFVRVRTRERDASRSVTARVRLGAVQCASSVWARSRYESNEPRYAGCSAPRAGRANPRNQVASCFAVLACALLSARRGRSRRW